jgi:triacylglycerol esterase/lipase EstA (alpha/beta hydrolase family)
VEYFLYPVKTYFHPIVKHLESLGYDRNWNISSAPYDFRITPFSNPNYIVETKKLIETLYERNNNTKLTIVSHSMGCLITLYLLQNSNEEWK